MTELYDFIEPHKASEQTYIFLQLYFFNENYLKSPSTEGDKIKFVTHRLNLFLNTSKPFEEFTFGTLYKYASRVTPDSFGVPPKAGSKGKNTSLTIHTH